MDTVAATVARKHTGSAACVPSHNVARLGMLRADFPPTCVVCITADRVAAEKLQCDLRAAGVPALLLQVNDPAELRPALDTVIGWERLVIILSKESQHARWVQRELDALALGVSALAGRVIWAATVASEPPVPAVVDMRDYNTGFPPLLSAVKSGFHDSALFRAPPPFAV